MSTILDALRKVEEENRTRNADARTRLLTTPQRFDLRPPRHQRVPWLVSMGLIVGGIALGAGLMGWERSTPPIGAPTGEEVGARTAPPTPAPVLTTSPEPERPAARSVVPPVLVARKEELRSPVTVPPQNVAAADITRTLPTPASEEHLIQRSPFVNTVEPERMTPPPSPLPVEQRGATRAKPAPKPTPPSPTPARTVEPPSAALEESDSSEVTPSAPQEEEQEEVAGETPSPPTQASVSFLQWSPEPEKRMAFIKVGNAPTTLAHEGDTVNGVRVVKIRQGTVELQSGESRWTLKAR